MSNRLSFCLLQTSFVLLSNKYTWCYLIWYNYHLVKKISDDCEMKLKLATIMQTRGQLKHPWWPYCMNNMILTSNKIFSSYTHKTPLWWNIYTPVFSPTKLQKKNQCYPTSWSQKASDRKTEKNSWLTQSLCFSKLYTMLSSLRSVE